MKPEPILKAEELVASRAVEWRPVAARIGNDRGRWLVRFADRSVFVKAAYDEASAEWLRTEALVYRNVHATFMPKCIGYNDVLVLEDLTDSIWPPPWTTDAIDAVRLALDELAGVTPPAGLPPLDGLRQPLIDTGWDAIEQDPLPFLSLRLCSSAWLESALPDLRAATAGIDLAGDSLVHVDLRSDNMCIRADTALFFDWNQASVGNPLFDLAEWLPSLAAEGGPIPETLLPHDRGGPYAAALAGFWGARAGLPAPAWSPKLREMQLMQARTALGWASRALGIPEPQSNE